MGLSFDEVEATLKAHDPQFRFLVSEGVDGGIYHPSINGKPVDVYVPIDEPCTVYHLRLIVRSFNLPPNIFGNLG